jgi:uncharacterized protein YfkK (UPF0435 family)
MACNPKLPTDPNGLNWHYFYDTKSAINKDIQKIGKRIKSFVEVVHHDNGKKDSSYLTLTMVDWKYYVAAFTAMNMYDSSFQGLYTMSQNIDTITNTVDIQYNPIYENSPIRKMQIKMDATSNEVKTVYAIIKNKSAFSASEQSIFYEPAKIIQIVEKEIPFSGKPKKTGRELHFVLGPPEIEIINELDQPKNK